MHIQVHVCLYNKNPILLCKDPTLLLAVVVHFPVSNAKIILFSLSRKPFLNNCFTGFFFMCVFLCVLINGSGFSCATCYHPAPMNL